MTSIVRSLARSIAVTSGFFPSQIADQVLWLDSVDEPTVISSGGQVSAWNDKSGLGNNAIQGTGSKQPVTGTDTIGGKNVLTWDAIDDELEIAATTDLNEMFGTGGTMVWVTDSDAVSFGRFYRQDNTVLQKRTSGTGNARLTLNFATDGRWTSNSSTFPVLSPIIMTLTYDASDIPTPLKFYANGALVGSSETVTPIDPFGPGAGTIFLGSNNGSAFFDGRIGEVIWYKRIITDLERAQLDSHLSSKWSIPLV